MKSRSKINWGIRAPLRGGAITSALVLCVVMLIIAAAFLTTVSREKKINHRSALLGQARNAAESVAELALAEMTRKAQSFSSQETFPLLNYTLPVDDVTFLSGGNTSGQVIGTSLAFLCGELSDRPTNAVLINRNDGVTGSDPDRDKNLSIRSCYLYGSASVRDAISGSIITSYVKETIQMREQSWFNYAVFYNMDMEFHAGPNFDITGPVHTNGDAYVMEGAGSTLNSHSVFTTHKQIFRFIKYALPNHSDGGFTGTVNFSSSASTLVSMDASQDSTRSDWLGFAQARWKYLVQDVAFNVDAFAPDNMPTYVPENFSTVATELRNYAYLLIEPQLSSSTVTPIARGVVNATTGSPPEVGYATGREGIKAADPTNVNSSDPESMKFSALSGFVIKVRPPDGGVVSKNNSGPFPHWYICYYHGATDNSKPVNKDNLPERNADGSPIEYIIDPFALCDTETTVAADQIMKWQLKQQLFRAIMSVPYSETGAVPGNRQLSGIQFSYPTATLNVPWVAGPDFTAGSQYFALYDRRQGYIYPNGGATNNQLFGAYNVLRIDMFQLNALLRDTTGIWNKPNGGGALYDPSVNYSGVVYVEFPLDVKTDSRFPPTTPDGDKIRPAYQRSLSAPVQTYALVLTNAGILPHLDTNRALRDDGFTIATNGPAYLVGSYNADGLSSTGSSTAPDVAVTPPAWANEYPSLVAADSVTVLSQGFDFSRSSDTLSTAPSYLNPPVSTNFTEISTAFITGLVPTHPGVNDIWSGGVHNFIRFLENWGGATYRYRGSLAALFESEVSTGAYHEGHNPFYGAPTRAMGYHNFLSLGWFPPGTPIKRTVRRVDLTDITKTDWDTPIPKPPTSG